MVAAHASPPPADLVELASALWTRDLPREHGFEPLAVEGTLPAELRGTLYRNGPGQFGQGGVRYAHPFEADGALTAVRIADGKALGATRITESRGLREERAAGRMLFGPYAPWPRRITNALRGRFKNTANTSVMVWQGRVLTMMEAAPPTEVEPTNLDTIGETDLGNAIVGAFSAHPHRVASRRATYNFGLQYGRVTKIHLYELPDEGAARHLGAVPIAAPVMLHDFIATDTHLVFFVAPVRIDVPRALLQLGTFDQLFRWRPEHGTEILCVPIDNPAAVVRFSVDAFYQWHFANAFARGGELVIDYIRYPDFASFHQIAEVGRGHGAAIDSGTFHRATIDLAARTLRSEPLAERGCEFPVVAAEETGREHALAYAVFDGMRSVGSIDARGRVVAHELPAGQVASEPVLAGAHLLMLTHTRDGAFVGVYDRARLPDGPIARIDLGQAMPITFHGTFAGS